MYTRQVAQHPRLAGSLASRVLFGDRRPPSRMLLAILMTTTLLTMAAAQPTTQPAATQPPASRPAASEPAPRILLRQDFESGRVPAGSGSIITDDLPAGSTRALAAQPTETHWARRATVPGRFTGAARTTLRFRYRISKDIPLTIYIMNRTQNDNLRYDIKPPVVGRWTEVTLNINTDFRRNDNTPGKLQEGDSLNGISFLAGQTGKDEFDLAIDDVEVTAP